MILASLLLLLAPQTPALGPGITRVEGFETGTNTGRWSFFGNPDNGIEVVEPSGGNPGAFLHSTCGGLGCLDTFAPELRTELGVDSLFTGNYRAKRVDALGVDLAIFHVDFSSAGRPLTLLLRHDPGTPGDTSDDTVVYRIGARNVPAPDGEWRTFRFRVPAQSTTLPGNWAVLQGSGNDDADWNLVIGDVSQAAFFFGDPTFFFIFQQWELGVDNLRIRLDARAL